MKTICMVACVLLIASAAPAAASAITAGQWFEFAFDTVGVPAIGCSPDPPTGACVPSDFGNTTFAGPPPWTFSLAQAGVFTITDAFLRGDAFNVFDFGALILSTPTVRIFGTCGSDPDFCVTNPGTSHGAVALAPGSHSITIVPTVVAPDIGAGFFRVDLPEPACYPIVGGALVVMGIVRKRRLSS